MSARQRGQSWSFSAPARTPEAAGQRSAALGKAAQRGCLAIEDLKNGVEFRDLKQVMHALGQPKQLQRPAVVRYGREPGNQLADSRAVDVRHFTEIEDDLLVVLGDQATDCLAKRAG